MLRRFAGVELGRVPAPDGTTLFSFRHLLETQQLGEARFPQTLWHWAYNPLRGTNP